jgi:hypothetical protein
VPLCSYICDGGGDLSPLRPLRPQAPGTPVDTPVDSTHLWINFLGQCRVREPLRRQCQRRPPPLCPGPTYVIWWPGSASVYSRSLSLRFMTLRTRIWTTQLCTPHTKECRRLRRIILLCRLPHRPVGTFTPLPPRRTPKDRDAAIPLSELTV